MSIAALKLPPHDSQTEAAALGVILWLASIEKNLPECDVLLPQLRPGLFYELRHKTILAELVEMRSGESPHSVDVVTLGAMLREKGQLENVGGYAYLTTLIEHGASTVAAWGEYIRILKGFALRRLMLAKAAELERASAEEGVTIESARETISELYETAGKLGQTGRPLIEVWTMADAAKWKPDPSTFLISGGILCKGELAILAGPPGVGKSRLGRSLGIEAARGGQSWQGYQLARRWRTFMLQSEDGPNRLHEESAGIDVEGCHSHFRVSLPCVMRFSEPAFRSELRRIWQGFPFDLLVLDNLNDLSRADGREDYLEALANIYAALPPHPDTPAILILAHLRKARPGADGKPMTGRRLLDELSGSYAMGAKARTVFALLPASNRMDDPRVIFETAKSNNGVPLPPSAWVRANGQFQGLPDFDWDEYHNPPDESQRRIVSEADLSDVFDGGRRALTRSRAVALLMEKGFAKPTCYRALELDGKFKERLEEKGELIAWKP